MNNQLVPHTNDMQNLQLIANTAHASGLYNTVGGKEKILMILLAAHDLGIKPTIALNGGIWNIQGKIEISARLMTSMIRRAGHNISIKECNKNICTLKGKRADNGDEIESSFSIQDATNAGLANRDVWKKYTEDMLYARAMSRLARRLFPDVIGTAYVEGEIRDGDLITVVPDQKEEVLPQKESWPTENQDEYVTNEQSQFIFDILSECSPKYKEKFLKGLEVLGITISQIKKENFEKTKKALFAQRELHKKTSETSVET